MLLNNPRLGISASDIADAAREIEKLEQERQKRSDVSSDRLVKSISDLTKTLINTEKNAARDKTGGGAPTLRSMISNKVSDIKSLTTGAGLFGKLASNTSNPIMNAAFGALSQRYARRDEEKQKTKDFVSSVATGTSYGRELTNRVGGDRASEMLKEDFKKQSALETKIYAKEEKRKAMVESGKKSGIKTDLDDAEIAELEQYKAELKEAKEKYKRTGIPMSELGGESRIRREQPPTSLIEDESQPRSDGSAPSNPAQSASNTPGTTGANRSEDTNGLPLIRREQPTSQIGTIGSETRLNENGLPIAAGRLIPANALMNATTGSSELTAGLDSQTLQSNMQDSKFSEIKSVLLESIKEGMRAEIGVLPKNELDILKAQGPDFMNGVGNQIFEEIQALSKEQLVQLIKISDLLEVDKETILESKNKGLLSQLPDPDKKEEPAAEKPQQLLSKLMDGLGGKLTDLLGNIPGGKIAGKVGGALKTVGAGAVRLGGQAVRAATPLLGSAARMGATALRGMTPFLGPAAVAGAGAAGYMAGGAINDAVEKYSGDTVGGNTYTGVQKFKQFMGLETDTDKQKKAEKQAVADLIEKKKKAGEPISTYLVGEAKKHNIDITGVEIQKPKEVAQTGATEKNVANSTEKNVANSSSNVANSTEKNVANQTSDLLATTEKNELKELIQKNQTTDASSVSSAVITNANSTATNLSNMIDNTSNINKQVSKDLAKINTASMLEQATDQVSNQKPVSANNSQPVVVNAPQTVNNQTNQIVRPPMRNADPSWLDTSSKRLAY